jgi:putative PIN family toxin of toxin-antitoxin system
MRVVLDANIFISSTISTEGNPAKIIDRWLAGGFDLLLSKPMIDDFLRVTSYERILKKYPLVPANRDKLIKLVNKNAVLVEPEMPLAIVLADETDNPYIECAVAGNAQYIVSGDQHLLDIGEYQGILIITHALFLTLLDSGLH